MGSVANAPVEVPRKATGAQEVLELSRAIHDSVIQRLAGASMALADIEGLAPEDRRRAAQEVTAALGDLRELLVAATRGLELESMDASLEQRPELSNVVLSVMAEALANIRKHASPGHISIHVSQDDEGLDLEVLNDGTPRDTGGNGMGLHLAELQLRSVGGRFESGPTTGDCWRVHMRLPATG
jgi:signal transduction histidine kinase